MFILFVYWMKQIENVTRIKMITFTENFLCVFCQLL